MPACKKGDVIQDPASLGRGSYVTLVKTTNNLLDFSNIAASTVSIDVKQLGKEQEKITVYISPGAATRDRSKWKKVKEIPNSNNGLYTVSLTGAEIAAAIAPAVIQPGNSYAVYNSVTTTDGEVFDFSNTSPTLSGNLNYSPAITWNAIVVCPFTGIGTDVDYEVVQDDWQNWAPGDIVKVSNGSVANTVDLSKVWPNPAYGNVVNKLTLNITQNTGAVAVTSGVIFGQYTLPTFSGPAGTLAGSSGYVFTCTGSIDVRIRVSFNGADQGGLRLVLKKK